MRFAALIVFLLGLIGLIYGLAMDTTVAVSEIGVGRVHNIGLISDRQSILIVSGLAMLIGVISEIGASLVRGKAPKQQVPPPRRLGEPYYGVWPNSDPLATKETPPPDDELDLKIAAMMKTEDKPASDTPR